MKMRSYLTEFLFRLPGFLSTLQYIVTPVAITILGIVFFSVPIINKPINCNIKEHKKELEEYCWSTSTYTNDQQLIVGYHKYFKYFEYVFIFQAAICCIPYFVFWLMHGNTLKYIASGLSEVPRQYFRTPEDLCMIDRQCNRILMHMQRFYKKSSHFFDAHLIFDILYLVNASGQLIFSAVIVKDVFPEEIYCLHDPSESNGLSTFLKVVCKMPLNYYYKLAYVILDYWFFFMFILSAVSIALKVYIWLSEDFRYWLIITYNPQVQPFQLKYCCEQLSVDNWFVLHKVSLIIDDDIFFGLIDSLTLGLVDPRNFKRETDT